MPKQENSWAQQQQQSKPTRRILSRLQSDVEVCQSELRKLQVQNEALRVHMLGVQISIRALQEVQRHQRAFGAGCPTHEAQLQCLQAELQAAGGIVDGETCGIGSSGRDPLLDRLPHLQPGASLLHLEGAKEPEVQRIREATPALLVTEIWKPLIVEAKRVAAGEAGAEADAEAEAGLWEVGLHMCRTFHLTLVWSYGVFVSACVFNYETGEVACGMADAPLSHWEGAVRAVRYTRVQALVTVDIFRSARARLAALAEERAALSADLEASTAAAAQEAPAAAMAFRGEATAHQEDVVGALEANLRREKEAMALLSQALCAVLSPAQLARIMCASYPWPVHTLCCVEVLEHHLKFRPESFADSL